MNNRAFTTTRRIVFLLALLVSIAFAADPVVPDPFLRMPKKFRNILEVPVSGTFREASPHEVIDALCRPLHVNFTYQSRDPSRPVSLTFTGTFKDTPLRTALYQVVQATRIKVALVDGGDGFGFLSFDE
jgi:hypothetical protein